MNLQMSKETLNLTKALKGDSKIQGNWGELVLESFRKIWLRKR
jgi:DNA recombination protein RmuC